MSPPRWPRQSSDEVSEQDNHPNRRRFSSEEKFKIVKEHLTARTPISELAKKYGMTPQSFYGWQEQFFEAALSGFDKKRGPKEPINKNDGRVEDLVADNLRMRDVIAEITAENVAFKKKEFSILEIVPPEKRGLVVGDIKRQIERTHLALEFFLGAYGIKKSTYHGWFDDDGTLLGPKTRVPINDRKILASDVEAVIAYRRLHPDIGYRKLTYQMIDENLAALSEKAVYNILKAHDMLSGFAKCGAPAEKEYRHKPKFPQHHWHTDIAYIKIQGVFYFLIMMLDGYSRYLLDWELMPDMLGSSVELFVQRVTERYPHARPKLIQDNGGQFISLDFKRLMQSLEIQQVRTRRNHPETNGKIERMNRSVKHEAIYPNAPQSYQEACEILNKYAYEYNHQRLHAGIHFLRPADMFFGRGHVVLAERDRRIEIARANRKKQNRQATAAANVN